MPLLSDNPDIRHRYTHTFGDVAARYNDLTTGKAIPYDDVMSTKVYEWREDTRTGWSGASAAEMREWISNGYEPDIPFDPPIVVPTENTTTHVGSWTDDPLGEFDQVLYDLAEPECYYQEEQRRFLGGIVVRVETTFASTVKATVPAAYGQWCAAVVKAIMAKGYDVNLTVFRVSRDMYGREVGPTLDEVILKKFGEPVSFRDFSAMFSPGGYRHLMFLSYLMTAEANGYKPNRSFSRSLTDDHKWGMNWDADTRTLEFQCHRRASSYEVFPSDDMTRQFQTLSFD